MTENKRFELDKHDCIYDNDSIAKDGGRETYWLIEYIQQKKLVEKMNKLADENKELKKENEQLKRINKGQELEIVRLHKLADAMSGVLRELGIYNVYDDETIEEIKNKIKGDVE